MRDIRSTRAYSLFIFTLVCSLISASIINSNISIGKDAFAKKTRHLPIELMAMVVVVVVERKPIIPLLVRTVKVKRIIN
jgi:hypothetical protein